jgi:hypothetical protein
MFLKIILSLYILLLVSISYCLDPAAVPENQWTEILDGTGFSPNLGNWSYENDFNGDPNNGLAWINGGHRGTAQDNHFYIFDPLTEEWTSLDVPTRPGKG